MPTILYAIFATDRAGSGAVRAATREAHRVYLRQPHADGVIVVLGGPTLADDTAMNGTLLVLQAPSKDAVLHFLAADPYALNDLFESVVVREWRCGLALPDLLQAPTA